MLDYDQFLVKNLEFNIVVLKPQKGDLKVCCWDKLLNHLITVVVWSTYFF